MSDAATGQGRAQAIVSGKIVMPPYLMLRDFLDEETAAGLFDFVLAHEAAFEPTLVGRLREEGYRPEVRASVGTRDLGPYRQVFRDRLRALLPELIERLGTTPVVEPKFELQLVAHNDGAFYKRHIDTQTARERDHIRVLSCVYYFHARPKPFSDGAFRLYAIGDPCRETFIDIEPGHNTALVFPAWAPHEVMPVSCPSGRFSDSRFAVNCWVYRKRPAPPAQGGDTGGAGP